MFKLTIKGIYEKQDLLKNKSNPLSYIMTNGSKNNKKKKFDAFLTLILGFVTLIMEQNYTFVIIFLE